MNVVTDKESLELQCSHLKSLTNFSLLETCSVANATFEVRDQNHAQAKIRPVAIEGGVMSLAVLSCHHRLVIPSSPGPWLCNAEEQ